MLAVLHASPPRHWTFITNHAQVLLAVAKKPDARVREIAVAADITERYAYRILRDLEDGGYVNRRRRGRGNVYRINRDLMLGDPVVEENSLHELLRLIKRTSDAEVTVMSAAILPSSRSPRSAIRSRAASG
ncbi:MAG TPA: helix-turn-helix domain-containing protein [Gaiellaceae bacterium]|jgi:DNA-binding transcriptional ArsR family regulator|nr:helix-turn-helix domain-containing protein [Gaiellaceae bacterium]